MAPSGVRFDSSFFRMDNLQIFAHDDNVQYTRIFDRDWNLLWDSRSDSPFPESIWSRLNPTAPVYCTIDGPGAGVRFSGICTVARAGELVKWRRIHVEHPNLDVEESPFTPPTSW